jgi:hypothetical protein
MVERASDRTIQLSPVLLLQIKFVRMSKAEILEQLPKLNSVELREICDRIWQLEEEQLLSGRANPSDAEKALLDSRSGAPPFERRLPVSVGFFLLRLVSARPNGLPTRAREF